MRSGPAGGAGHASRAPPVGRGQAALVVGRLVTLRVPAGEQEELTLQGGDTTPLTALGSGRGNGRPTSRHEGDAQQRGRDEGGPPGHRGRQAHDPQARGDRHQDREDGGAATGGRATGLAGLVAGAPGLCQLTFGPHGADVPHGGSVHGSDLRWAAKDRGMTAASTGLVSGGGLVAGLQDPQLRGVAVLGIGLPHHLTASDQVRQEVHGKDDNECDQRPDLHPHTSTVFARQAAGT